MTDQTDHFDCLIVGAGHAGAETAISLRQSGYDASVGLVGAEPVPPYERPAMSKEYLAGKNDFDQLLLRPADYWATHHIALRLGRRVTTVDADAHLVTCDDGSVISYHTLVWAAGGVPRALDCPGHDLVGVRSIRTKADCDQLIAVLPRTERVVVIGGGYVGLEAAAVLRELGKQVDVVEALDRVLARVTGEPVSRFYETEHRSQGVRLHLGMGVAEILGRDGAVIGVRLTDGTVIDAEQVIVGIGVEPAIQPLLDAGAESTSNRSGVLVDDVCRTTIPDIYCVGDCSILRNGPGIRIESRQNAYEQAHAAAKAISGRPEPLRLVPWFWSNQYDVRLQTVGLSAGHDQVVLRGHPGSRSFSLVYLKNGVVIALDCINAARDYIQGRKLVEAGTRVPPDLLADERQPLKALAISA
ncbi:NAD(P)/FAD-dependent oxidoreductase [Kribbella sp. NPDC050124]|uniref:NAD(P)/FAD-dependent oxidoreductase n=1 Tax=Kribbella sp. NPDC050124 TaxID=3364114 RepID=UPI003793D589